MSWIYKLNIEIDTNELSAPKSNDGEIVISINKAKLIAILRTVEISIIDEKAPTKEVQFHTALGKKIISHIKSNSQKRPDLYQILTQAEQSVFAGETA
jgi:hypothetical protein